MTSISRPVSFRPAALLAIAGLAGIGGALAIAGAPALEAGSVGEEEVRSFVVSSSSTGVLEGNRVDRAPRGSPVDAVIPEFNVEEGRLERAPPRLSPPAADRRSARDEPGGGRMPREGERLEAPVPRRDDDHGSEEPGSRPGIPGPRFEGRSATHLRLDGPSAPPAGGRT